MKWARIASLILALLVFVPAGAFASAEEVQTTATPTPSATNIQNMKYDVILVGDNEADKAMAEYLAKVIGAKVIVLPWGVYDEAKVGEILAEAPARVVIIGGNVAVPEDYENALSEYGIQITRLAGEDRYDTNYEIFEFLAENYPQVLENEEIVIADGLDDTALMVEEGKPVLLMDEKKAEKARKILERIKAKKMRGVWSDEKAREKVKKALERLGIPEDKIEEATPEQVREGIRVAIERHIEKIEHMKSVLAEKGADDAVEKLSELEKELREAINLYNEGKYKEAIEKLREVNREFGKIVAEAHKKVKEKREERAEDRKELVKERLEMVRELIEKLDERGYDTTPLKEALAKIEEDIKAGDYETAKAEMDELMERVREIVKTMRETKEEKEERREKIKERLDVITDRIEEFITTAERMGYDVTPLKERLQRIKELWANGEKEKAAEELRVLLDEMKPYLEKMKEAREEKAQNREQARERIQEKIGMAERMINALEDMGYNVEGERNRLNEIKDQLEKGHIDVAVDQLNSLLEPLRDKIEFSKERTNAESRE